MLLIVTCSDDPTADFVQQQLVSANVVYRRLNTDQLFTHFTNNTSINPGGTEADTCVIFGGGPVIDLSKVTSVWYRRPKAPKAHPAITSPQAILYAEEEGDYYLRNLLALLGPAIWVSKPEAIRAANVKLHQLMVARKLGLAIPKSLATTDPEEAYRFFISCDGNVIVKPFTRNILDYGDTQATILTSKVKHTDTQMFDQVRLGITFFQEYIPKEFEVRVTVIGNHVFSTKIDSQSDPNRMVDWRSTSPNQPRWMLHEIPQEIVDKCRQIVRHYGLNFGALDFAFTPQGEYVFFELNPNGQWAWQEIELGLPMTQQLIKTLCP